jgi:superfamily II DNA/RNA helicase
MFRNVSTPVEGLRNDGQTRKGGERKFTSCEFLTSFFLFHGASLSMLEELGFEQMTPVQKAVIPQFTANKDVCVEVGIDG